MPETALEELIAKKETPPPKITKSNLGGLPITKASQGMKHINMLVYGDSGVGKTVLAASAAAVKEMSPVLLLDVEGGTFSIREKYADVDVVRVQTWKDMQAVYDALFNNLTYKTIILDSLTEIQKFSMYNIMDDLVGREPDRDPDVPGMREWGKNTEQIRKIVRAFRDLECNAIFTALATSDKDAKTGILKTKPSLSGKLKDEVAGFVDEVVFMYKKIMGDDIKRLLLTSGTDQQVAKDRSDKLPVIIEDPTMMKLYDYMFNTKEN